jgi:F-type H+-transporting ATPase subunit a
MDDDAINQELGCKSHSQSWTLSASALTIIEMFAKFSRNSLFAALAIFATLAMTRVSFAAPEDHTPVGAATEGNDTVHGANSGHGEGGAGEGGHEAAGPRPVFEPEHPTWFNIAARNIFATAEDKKHMAESKEEYEALRRKAASGAKLSEQETVELKMGPHYVTKYDWLLYTPLLWLLLAVAMVSAAKKIRVRPGGKPASLANTVEAAVDGFQDYLIAVMGEGLARKYTPLIASFFFTILISNWLGLVPGMAAATAQPAVPISIAIVAFLAVHVIAIKEAGIKSWFMHFVGEPVWLAPLNFPLHMVGELIKPLSLSLRLLCNVFGEEAVIITLSTLALQLLPLWLPIPFQLPMLFLGSFFGLLQALVFSTLLAIYISILATHHDDHDEHNNHGHVEHDDIKGHHQIVAHSSVMTVG